MARHVAKKKASSKRGKMKKGALSSIMGKRPVKKKGSRRK